MKNCPVVKEAVRNYFAQLSEQEEDYLFEAKMLIVGEPGAGKTSMAWKMENPECAMPKEEETTKGIDVRQYYFPLQKSDFPGFKHPEKLENRNFRLNLWDFGGQEIYKATHRFFLSKRSLYSLVADSRNEDTDFNYWLHIVEMFGGDSPLLIVLNEKYQRKRIIDIASIQNRFANIREVLDVDFAEEDKTRLNKLEKAVKYYVSQLPHIGSPVPAKWKVVREALESDKRNTITLQDYLKICEDNGITKTQDALVLSQYFHDIGVYLHFQDDELLRKTIFLKPNWATNAVYKILDHPLLNKKNGRFNKADAKVIWSEDEYELIRDELLRLMQKFFLTYEIKDSGEYIVPERLPPAQPQYHWEEKDNLFLRYDYDVFMPKGIMSQFTVQMHRYISNHNHVWQRGVVLEREETTAEIIETYDARRIKIRISGKNRRDFMTIITEELDQINAPYEKMKVDKRIPCNCDECQKSAETEIVFYPFKELIQRRSDYQKGKQAALTVQCRRSYEQVNVFELLDDVFIKLPDHADPSVTDEPLRSPSPQVVVNVNPAPTTEPNTQVPAPEIEPKEKKTSAIYSQWPIISLAVALPLGGLLASLLRYVWPSSPLSVWLSFPAFTALAFIILLKQNPRRRYFRVALSLITLATFNIIPQGEILIDKVQASGDGNFLKQLLSLQIGDNPLVSIVALGLAGFLFWLDSKQ